MESEFWALENEHCLLLSDSSIKIVSASKWAEVEKKQKRLPGETAFLSELECLLKCLERNRSLKRAHPQRKLVNNTE